jgi:type 1 glutamine amidotransferase
MAAFALRALFAGSVVAACVIAAGTTDAHAQTRRVLYVDYVGPNAHRHDSLPNARAAVTALGQSSGAFTVTVTDDPSLLTAATLADYDAVLFYTCGDLPLDGAQRQALLDFVARGNGFMGVHSAADSAYSWPEYAVLLGGRFRNHSVVATGRLRVEDAAHVAMQAFTNPFTITDEFYEFVAQIDYTPPGTFTPFTRADKHVLMNLDPTSVPPFTVDPGKTDFPLAWTRTYGAGRVFYTALGHSIGIWDDARFRGHVLAGIRWALGDGDGDGLRDDWETRWGLQAHDAAGANGAAGDPDGDGLTNAQEQAADTHPRGVTQRYLAEGATSPFFETRVSLLNPDPAAPAHVQLRFQREDGHVDRVAVTLGPQRRHGLVAPADSAFSTLIESDIGIVADRTMTWGDGRRYGSHAESAVTAPATSWYFAEGATSWNFDLFYLVQNPGTTAATVDVTFLRDGAPAVTRRYTAAPASRLTIAVDAIPGLEAAEMAAAFESATPVIVERAMYLSRPGEPWSGGHASAGVTALAPRWFLAEGATGDFFSMFVLIGNPGTTDVPLRVSYLLPDGGRVDREHTVRAQRRLTLNPVAESPLLAYTSLSVVVESLSGDPIVVERAMWWPGGGPTWYEGHSTLGVTTMGRTWAMAEAVSGGPDAARTYVLVASGESPTVDSLRVLAIRGTGPPLERILTDALRPGARLTIDVGGLFPELAGERIGIVVESMGQAGGAAVTPMPIVVERAMYADAGGPVWSQGSNLVATRLR